MARSLFDHRLVVHQATGAAVRRRAHACRSGLPFGSRGKAGISSSARGHDQGGSMSASVLRSSRDGESFVALDHGAEGPSGGRVDRHHHRIDNTGDGTQAGGDVGEVHDAVLSGPYRVVQPPGQHQIPVGSESSAVLRRPPPVHVSRALDVGRKSVARHLPWTANPDPPDLIRRGGLVGMVADVDLHAVERTPHGVALDTIGRGIVEA